LVRFIKRIEIASFEGAKLITNGLVVEGRFKKDIKQHIDEIGTSAKLNFSKYPTRKNRGNVGVGWGDRHGGSWGFRLQQLGVVKAQVSPAHWLGLKTCAKVRQSGG